MRVVGHRGCPALAPENTLAAFEAAAEVVPCIELDVRRCGSGELVVFHDETLSRLTGASGRVADTPFSELRRLTVGDSDESIPLLSEVFEVIPHSTCVNVECKHAGVASDLQRVVADVPNEILVSSFEREALREVTAETSLSTALLFSRWWRRSLRMAKKLGCAAIHPRYDLLSRERVEAAHDEGFEVNAWTVLDRETVRRLAEWGIDGVIVDDPKIAES
ncbi:glycerophosphodiester phosphodiesterase [Haloferax namakaokahaiae]|uniref:Glycerophosphodiester phosphodiesterase n=1 Tax=Haloferax namakaokahaiae TaxID=1748331 RepID=A0ABD5ZAW2_9EURY